MKSLKEKIEIMQAAEDGAIIEYCYSEPFWFNKSSEWAIAINPTWDWEHYDYRIAIPMPIKQERIPKMPEALLWWVDFGVGDLSLVSCINGNRFSYTRFDDIHTISLEMAVKNDMKWSPDRKTWYNFYGEEVVIRDCK